MVRMGVVHIRNDDVDNVKSILLEEFDGTIVRIKNAEGYGTNMNNELWCTCVWLWHRHDMTVWIRSKHSYVKGLMGRLFE